MCWFDRKETGPALDVTVAKEGMLLEMSEGNDNQVREIWTDLSNFERVTKLDTL